MHIPITIAALVLLTVVMFFVRLFWMRIHPDLRFTLICASIAAVLIHGFFTATKWGTSSTYINVIINWLAVAGYELLVLLFTRLSPRWLTSLCAAILLAPLFAT